MPKKNEVIIEYRNYALPSNFPVLLLSGNRWRISDIKSGRLHFHNCLEIGICHTDSGIMEFENLHVPFKAGDITMIPRDYPHTTYSDPGTESLWSYVFLDPGELFRGLLNNFTQSLDVPQPKDQHSSYLLVNKESNPKVHFLLTSVIQELQECKINYQASVRGLLLSLCIELFRIHGEQNKVVDGSEAEFDSNNNALVILPALDYIRFNYMQQFSIETLASLCHFSVTHFRRIFHSIMDISPLEYINNLRIYKACSLLRSTEDSILTISEQVGYHSISSFNRCFIKVVGMPPRRWRNEYLQVESKNDKQSIWKFSGWI